MPSHRGRDLLIKIGDGEDPESFFTLGAARTVSVSVSNTPANATHLDSGGQQEWRADAGVQRMQITLDGFFKDTAAEEKLAAAAFSPTANNYRLFFPNGDVFAAAFIVQDYRRSGAADGLEGFTVTLARTGGGEFLP